MLKDMWKFKDTAAGKFFAVAMSVILVIGMTNTNALAFGDEAEDQPETMEVSDVLDLTKVTFEIGEGATVEADGSAVEDGDAVEAPSHEAFSFKAKAADDYIINSVEVNGEEVEADKDGAYEIAAEAMNGDAQKIQVKTEAAPAEDPEEAEEPAQPEQPTAPAEEEATQETPAPEKTTREAAVATLGITEPLADNGVNALANDGTRNIYVGERIRLVGANPSGSYNHSWSSSNTNVAAVAGNENLGDVSGLRASNSTVTITHTYYTGAGWWPTANTETFTVKVLDAPAQEAGTTRVYVYFKLDGQVSTEGWEVNKDGWYTIGYVDVPNLESASDYKKSQGVTDSNASAWATGSMAQQVSDLINQGKLVRHSENKELAFDFDAVKWSGTYNNVKYGLHTANGASGYNDDETAWHLDGYLTLQQKATVKVNYSYCEDDASDGPLDKLPANVQETLVVGKGFGPYEIPAIEDYVPVCSDSRFSTESPIHFDAVLGDKTINVVYHKDANGNNIPDCQEEKYTVKYLPGEVSNAFEEKVYEALLDGTATPPAPSGLEHGKTVKDGKRFTGWSPIVAETVSEDVDYVAQWESAQTLIYDKNADDATGTMEPQTGYAGDEITLKSNGFLRSGYMFDGWNTKADGSGTSYGNRAAYSFINGENALYAQWTPIISASVYLKGWVYDGQEAGSPDHEPAIEPGLSHELFGSGAIKYFVRAEDGNWIATVGKPKNVGTYKIVVTWEGDGQTVASFSKECEFRITPRQVTVTADKKTKTYSDLDPELTTTVLNVVGSDKINFSLEREPGENVGSYSITPSGAESQGNYTVVFVPGTLEIAKREITVAANGGSKQYDGKPLTAEETGYKIAAGTLAPGQTETVALSGSRTLVGSDDAVVSSVVVKDAEGNDVTSNYDVTKADGTLTVTNRDAKFEVTLVANSSTGNTYDGTEKSVSGVETDKFTIDGVEYTVSGYQTSSPAETAAGTYANNVTGTFAVRDAQNNDVTSQFKVNTQNGTLEIAKREIVLESDSFEKTYDGKPLTNKDADGAERPLANAGDFVGDEGVELSFDASITNVSESGAANSFDFTAKKGTDLNNYAITMKFGTLTITPLNITNDPDDPSTNVLTVVGPDDVIYNGQEQKLRPISVKYGDAELVYEDWTVENPAENGYWIEHANGLAKDFTNAGNTIEILIHPNSSNFEGYATVKYQIKKRPATIYAGAASMTYAAPDTLEYQVPTAEAFDAEKDRGFVATEVPATIQQALKSEVGAYDEAKRYENEVTIIGRTDLEAALTNYDLSYVDNYLDVNNATDNVVTVNNIAGAAGMTKMYNGVATSVVANARVEGSSFEYSLDGVNWSPINPTFTNVGTYTVWVRANAANYETTRPVSARVTITPAPVTITVNAATKVAGTADPTFTGTVTGLVNAGDLGAISFVRTNTAQGAGIYPNVLTARYLANPNYTVTVVPATFTITAAPVVPGPVTPVTPTPPTPPAGGGGGVPVPAAAVDTPAPVAIGDDPTPMTNLPEAGPQRAVATIEEDEIPQTAFDNEDPDCWVHFLMILGILLTIVYAGCVVARRTNFTRGLKSREEDFIGETTEETVAVPAGMTAAVRK